MIQRTLLVTLMILYPFTLTSAADWPQWRGPDRNGVSKETGLLESWPPGAPKLLWTFRDAETGFSCMSVVGDRLYSMGAKDNKEYVYAIDLKTQKKLWSVEIGPRFENQEGDGPRSTPTIDGNFLYAIGSHGNLVCVETTHGRKVWSQELVKDLSGVLPHYGFTESPLVDGDQVIATPGGKKGVFAAFNKKTGALKWRSAPFTSSSVVPSYSSMITTEIGGIRQYIQILIGVEALVGVRASDGKLLWMSARGGYVSTPISKNDCVYVTSTDGCFLIQLKPDGDKFKTEPIYANREMHNYYSGVILVGEYIYGFDGVALTGPIRGNWICQDFKTGKTIWKKNLRLGCGSVTYADGNLYCYHENKGDMLLIKATPAGYKEQGRFRIPEETKLPRKGGRIYTSPVVANGKLYLRDQDLIFCYDIHKPR